MEVKPEQTTLRRESGTVDYYPESFLAGRCLDFAGSLPLSPFLLLSKSIDNINEIGKRLGKLQLATTGKCSC